MHAYRRPSLLGLTIVASASIARAEPPAASTEPATTRVPPEPEPAPQPPAPTAATVAGAPLPGHENGRLDPVDSGDSTGRVVARTVLYVPKLAFQLGMLPLKGGFYAYDRYELDRLYYETLFNRDRTMGVIPTATYETGFGFTVGARFFDDDTFGHDEGTVLQATIGTVYRVGLLGSIDTGNRLGPLRLELAGNFDRRPAEPFYGIGNGGGQSGIENPGPMPDVNALVEDTPVRAFTRYQETRGVLFADWSVFSNLRVGAHGSITDIAYDPSSTGPSVNDVYDPMSLIGFDSGVQHVYGEAEIAWDSRHRTSRWEPVSVNSSGSLALGFGGYVHRFDDQGGNFWHYGVELQHYFHLWYGPRTLIARFHGEAVTGPLDVVPFTELPMLGGDAFLRGYPYARFRDRIAGVASLQYMWNLSQYAEAFVFVDSGRVWRSYDDLSLDALRWGFGGGLEFHSLNNFLLDASIGTSSDGGIVLLAAFSPVLNARPRWR